MSNDFLTRVTNRFNSIDAGYKVKNETRSLVSLRPKSMDEYKGQPGVVETLEIAMEAAKQRSEPLEHALFHGPPGLGKTTLAHIIANDMGGKLTVTSGQALEKAGDLIGILTHLNLGDVLFIDEIHRISKNVEEFLYPVMEDFAVDFIFDKGLHARSHRYKLSRFTLVGATSRIGLLSAPFRDRFGFIKNLDFYHLDELAEITMRSANLLDVKLDYKAAIELAKCSRGTPRIVNRLLKRVRDYAQVRENGMVDKNTVKKALNLEGVDSAGLTHLDRNYLNAIISFYNGGPVGIEAISATLQEESDTLVDVVEPFMLKIGFIIRTSLGRKVTSLAYKHLGI